MVRAYANELVVDQITRNYKNVANVDLVISYLYSKHVFLNAAIDVANKVFAIADTTSKLKIIWAMIRNPVTADYGVRLLMSMPSGIHLEGSTKYIRKCILSPNQVSADDHNEYYRGLPEIMDETIAVLTMTLPTNGTTEFILKSNDAIMFMYWLINNKIKMTYAQAKACLELHNADKAHDEEKRNVRFLLNHPDLTESERLDFTLTYA